MPIITIEQVSPDISLGIWKIEESIETLYGGICLSESEITEYQKYTHPKRKKEWLGARNVLNTLLKHHGYDYSGLHKGKLNKPVLRNNSIHVSLAHSYPFAVALFHRNSPCGIDIEKAKPALVQISYRFLSDRELSFINHRLDSLCLAWSAKEAIYKMYGEMGLSFRNNIHLAPFEPLNEGEISAEVNVDGMRNLHQLAYRQVDGFFICFSCQ